MGIKWIGTKRTPEKQPSNPVAVESSEAEFTPLDTAQDVLDKEAMDRQETVLPGKQKDLEECPNCHATVRHLKMHYVRKPECLEAARKVEASIVEEVFPQAVGIFLVRTAVNLLKQKWPEKFRVMPGGDWLDRSGELHTRVLNRYLGPRVRENADAIMLLVVWGEFVAANQLYAAAHPAADDARNRAAGDGKDAPGAPSHVS